MLGIFKHEFYKCSFVHFQTLPVCIIIYIFSVYWNDLNGNAVCGIVAWFQSPNAVTPSVGERVSSVIQLHPSKVSDCQGRSTLINAAE